MFNLPLMQKFFFVALFILTGNILFAQYVHYSDKRNVHTTESSEPAPKTTLQPIKKISKDTITVFVKDTVRIVMHDTVKTILKTIVHDTVRIFVKDTIEVVVHDTVNICPTNVVYHKWPDRCPGLSGAVPVIMNYIPPEMILKLTEIYKGHLYSISAVKNAANKVRYKLKVCENGIIKYEYADENGNIISHF